MREIEATLKGMSYRLKPDTIREAGKLCPIKVTIKRDEENIHDENAIAVFSLEPPLKKIHIGYIDRAVAGELAPRMDKGELEFVEGWLMEVDEDGTGPLSLKFKRPK